MRVQSHTTKIDNLLFQQDYGLPSMPLRISFDGTIEKFPSGVLYMLRSARDMGLQRNCPKCSGASYEQACKFASQMVSLGYRVFYYPFYVAVHSGIALITKNTVIVDECDTDLWQMLDETVSPARSFICYEARQSMDKLKELTSVYSPGLYRYITKFLIAAEIDTIGFEYMYGYAEEGKYEFIILEVYHDIHAV